MESAGLDHIIITISNVVQSHAFYRDLLGFALYDLADGFYFKCGGVSFFFFPSRQPRPADRFDEFRIGLDHLAFAAPDEAALYALAEKLKAAHVETHGVETYQTGNKYVAFRDPDNIQLEYWLPKRMETSNG